MIKQTQTSSQTWTAQEPLLVSAFPPMALVPGCRASQPSPLAEAFAREHINPVSNPSPSLTQVPSVPTPIPHHLCCFLLLWKRDFDAAGSYYSSSPTAMGDAISGTVFCLVVCIIDPTPQYFLPTI